MNSLAANQLSALSPGSCMWLLHFLRQQLTIGHAWTEYRDEFEAVVQELYSYTGVVTQFKRQKDSGA